MGLLVVKAGGLGNGMVAEGVSEKVEGVVAGEPVIPGVSIEAAVGWAEAAEVATGCSVLAGPAVEEALKAQTGDAINPKITTNIFFIAIYSVGKGSILIDVAPCRCKEKPPGAETLLSGFTQISLFYFGIVQHFRRFTL